MDSMLIKCLSKALTHGYSLHTLLKGENMSCVLCPPFIVAGHFSLEVQINMVTSYNMAGVDQPSAFFYYCNYGYPKNLQVVIVFLQQTPAGMVILISEKKLILNMQKSAKRVNFKKVSK